MDYYEQLNSIRQQNLQGWLLSERQAKKAYGEVADLVASRIQERYVAAEDVGEHKPIDVEFKNLAKDELDGRYLNGKNSMELDRKLARFDRDNSFLTTVHEGAHAGQERAARTMPDGLASPERDLLCNTWYSANRSAFGIDTSGSAYIQSRISGHELESDMLRINMHKAQFIEREARMEAIDVGEHIGLETGHIKHGLVDAAQCLRGEYSLGRTSDEEIFKMMDSAQIKTIHGDQPSSATEASMVYDMSALMYEQNAYMTRNPEMQQTAAQIWDPNVKAQSLSDAGFEYAQVVPLYKISEMDPQEIAGLSQIARDESPMFMSAALYEYGEEIVPLINKESYDGWYFSQDNNLSIDVTDRIAEIMGPEYVLESPELKLDIGESVEIDLNASPLIGSQEINLDGHMSKDVLGFDTGRDSIAQAMDGVGEFIMDVIERIR